MSSSLCHGTFISSQVHGLLQHAHTTASQPSNLDLQFWWPWAWAKRGGQQIRQAHRSCPCWVFLKHGRLSWWCHCLTKCACKTQVAQRSRCQKGISCRHRAFMPDQALTEEQQTLCESFFQVRKNSLNIKFLGGRDIRDPDVGISRTKTLCKWPFSVVLDREWLGCPGIWVGTSRIWTKLYARNFGLIFRTLSFLPNRVQRFGAVIVVACKRYLSPRDLTALQFLLTSKSSCFAP